MTLHQLYYTSCEHGLTGYAGYQFNAVTPGAGEEMQRQVRSLIAYEPPRSLMYPQDEAELAACPVNLCYRAASAEAPAVLANVEYLGRDFSKRFGNYFAHALAAAQQELEAGLGSLLPIELWRSPIWQRAAVDGTNLPALDGELPGGLLHPGTVHEFLRARPSRARLAELVTAVSAAGVGERPVLLVEQSADEVAQWVGAVCYLLPPPLAARVSFATYCSKPVQSRLDLIGTVRENAALLGPDTMDVFTVFDFTADRFTQVPPHALPELTARIGPLATGDLWEDALRLANGGEQRLDDWYPVTIASAALGGVALARREIETAVEWLRGAQHLDPHAISEVGRALHTQSSLPTELLPMLAEATSRGADRLLHEELRFEQIDFEMAQAAEGRSTGRLRMSFSPEFARRVADRFVQFLGDAPIAEAIRLLDWADENGIAEDGVHVARLGRRLAAALTGGGESAADLGSADLLETVARRHATLRHGLVERLRDIQLGQREPLDAVLAGLAGRLLEEQDVEQLPALHEAFLVSRALRHPAVRPMTLARLLRTRGEAAPTVDLLERLWPGDSWSAEAAAAVAGYIPLDRLADPRAAQWFLGVLRQATRPQDLEWYLPLCRALLGSAAVDAMDTASLVAARLAVEADSLTRGISDIQQVRQAVTLMREQNAMIRILCERRVPPALMAVPPRAADVEWVLPRLTETAALDYLRRLGNRGWDRDGWARPHFAGIFVVRDRLPRDGRVRAEADQLLTALARQFRPRDWDAVHGVVAALDPTWGSVDFRAFEERKRRDLRKLFRRRPEDPGPPPGTAADPDLDPDPTHRTTRE
ncbi:MAG TPA: GTPase-associated protein 1-related protein [Actinospica sp.]|jgi:hypothetical protein|nr:GTPase-associated protein 1-related protein [Actinospica sp.]